MSYGDDESRSQSSSAWIRQTHQARQECVEVREQIPPQYVHTPPYQVPEVVDLYNRMLQKYASQVRAKADTITGGKWVEEVASVQVPDPDDTVELGRQNAMGELDISRAIRLVDTREVNLALRDLRDWSSKQVRIDVVYETYSGQRQADVVTEPLYLPVRAADRLFDQLDRCLDDLGWLPDAAEIDISGEDQPLQVDWSYHEGMRADNQQAATDGGEAE